MATANTAAKDEAANDFASDYGTATLTIFDATNNALVVHTLAGLGSPTAGLLTASAIADQTILLSDDGGGASYAELTATGKTYTLSVGLSGSEVNVSNLTFVAGGNSSVTSLTVQF